MRYLKFVIVDIENMDILTGQNLSSIKVANMDHIKCPVRSFSGRAGDWVKGVDGRYRYFSQLGLSLYHRVHDNLVQKPSNYVSIFSN